MKKHNKICSLITALLIIMTMLYVPQGDTVHADSASITIALSASNVRIGQSVTATINVSGASISAYTLYVSYSSSVLQYSSATGVVGGGGGTLTVSGTGPGATSITFSAIANGTASISTSGSEFYDINGTALDVSHAGVSVTVATEEKKEEKTEATTNEKGETEATTEEDDRSNDCDLSSLSVSPGSLSPSFSAGQTSYTVELTEEDTSIVVSAVTHDSKASTSVSGANSLQKGTNRVSVTVTAENGAVKVYYLTVMCGKDKEDIIVSVNGRNYILVTENLPDPPENFTEITLVVGEEDVPGYEAPNVRYVIVDKPDGLDAPKGFRPAKLEIEEDTFNAFSDGSGSGIYLVYAMNLDGTEGFYFYDSKEGSFMRYEAAENIIASMSDAQVVVPATTEATTVETTTAAPVIPKKETEKKDEGFFTNARLKFLLVAMSVLFVIMCIAVIVLIIRNGNMTSVPEDGYPDNEDDDSDTDPDTPDGGADNTETAEAEEEKLTKNKSYSVNQDTGEIQLEVAEDFNSSVNVPLAVEERKDKIENAKKERPFGIDSAFNVVPETEAGDIDAEVAALVEEYTKKTDETSAQAPEETPAPKGTYTEVKEAPKQKVVLPGQDDEEE